MIIKMLFVQILYLHPVLHTPRFGISVKTEP
jgi:hypothetical protein